MAGTLIEARDRGAAVLTRFRGDDEWAMQVDTDFLEMRDVETCVFGQVFHLEDDPDSWQSYNDKLIEVLGEDEDPMYYGFDSHSNTMLAELQVLWIDLIDRMQAAIRERYAQ